MTESNQTITYSLTDLHCGACINKITQALTPLAAGVKVSLQPLQVVPTDAEAGYDTLKTAVEGAGKYVLVPNHALNMALAQSKPAQSAPKIIARVDPSATWLAT